MHNPPSFLRLLSLGLLLSVICLFWAHQRFDVGPWKASEDYVLASAGQRPKSLSIEPIDPAPAAPKHSSIPIGDDQFAALTRFQKWCIKYKNATPDLRDQLLVEGKALAVAHTAAIASLIPAEPQMALEWAVPMVVRQELPEEMLHLLEERVHVKGDLAVLAVSPGSEGPAIRRYIENVGEKEVNPGLSEQKKRRWRVYVYGDRLGQPSVRQAQFHGVAVGADFAVAESRVRMLEPGEQPNPSKPVETACPISGAETAPAVAAAEPPAFEDAEATYYLCSGGHIEAVEERYVAAEGGEVAAEGSTGGSQKPSGTVPGNYTTGVRTHLYMRVTFPDQLTDPQGESDCYSMMRQVSDFMIENSYGRCYFITTVTPLLVLPRTEAYYKQLETEDGSGDGQVLTDARAAAKAAGYDPGQYDFDTVRYSGGPGSFGGQAYVGGKGCWLKSSSVGVACHEYGHNLGLWHANYWNTSPASVIGNGSNAEYGNSFDTMGAANAGANHFGAYNKSVLQWMSAELYTTVTKEGVYRIRAMDQPVADPTWRLALKIQKDSDRDYWCEFRQKFTSNNWMMNGIQLTWDRWASSSSGPQLLDTTPNSPDAKTDSALVIGRTFSDEEAGIHITPLGKAGTTPESMDVAVRFGHFPENQAPSLQFTVSSATPDTGAPISLIAEAVDPDGDSLAYAWDFGDKSFSTNNAPAVVKSWATAGLYWVRCTVSDLKGKTTSSGLLIRVGSSTKFIASGRVLGPDSAPLAGVVIANGQTGPNWRGSISDSDGNFVVPGLDAGDVTLNAALAGYSFTPGFVNPLPINADRQGLLFTATASTTLTLMAVDAAAAESPSDTARFRLTRTGSTSSALSVRLLTPSGTASKGGDYTLAPDLVLASGNYTVSIPAGAASLDMVLTPVNDTASEGLETCRLQLVSSANYVISGEQTAIVNIADDDSTLPVVSIGQSDLEAHESGDPASFEIVRSGPTTTALTVNLTWGGAATRNTDYDAPTSLVIPAGAGSAIVIAAPKTDTAVEGHETLTLTVASSGAYLRNAQAQTATAYLNDANLNSVSIIAADNAANESGDPGAFLITRTGNLSQPLTVDYALSGSALQGTDYHKVPGQSVIPAGQTSVTVAIRPIDDVYGEVQQTIICQVRSSPSYRVVSPSSASINLNDNDISTLWVSTTDATATEAASGPGSDTAKYRIYRGGSGALTARYTISGTGTSGDDFTELSGTVAFATGDTTKDITITPLADDLLENAESVILTLTPDAAYTIEQADTAVVYIVDQDQPTVSISVEEFTTVSEGSTTPLRFWISRNGGTGSALAVSYVLSGTATSGADYAAPPGVVAIPSGAAGAYVLLTPINDTDVEGTEDVRISLSAGAEAYGLRVSEALAYFSDNETLPVQVQFSSGSSTVSEAIGEHTVDLTLSEVSTAPVSVLCRIASGSATGGAVDVSFDPIVVTFQPGQTNQSVLLRVVDDNVPEPSETLAITLLNASGAGIGTSTHTVTITDNDDLPPAIVHFAASSSSVAESVATPVLAVALSAPSTSAVSVDYTVTGGSATAVADYVLASGTIDIPAGALMRSIPIQITNDPMTESGETVIVTLSNAHGAAMGANTVHTLTITDDDAPIVNVVAVATTISEGNTSAVFMLSRSGAVTVPLSVNYALSGSATAISDYLALVSPVTFPALASTVQVSIPLVDDALPEGVENLILTVTTGTGYTVGTPASATVDIVDSDIAVSLNAGDTALAEPADHGSLTITRSGIGSGALRIPLLVSGTGLPDVDWTALPNPVEIPAGQLAVTIPITVLDDSTPEETETLFVALESSPAYALGVLGSVQFTIADDDVFSTVTVEKLDAESKEFGLIPARLRITRNGSLAASLQVPLTYAGSAAPGVDYSAPSLVTIPQGAASATIHLQPLADTLAEGTEMIITSATLSSAYTVIGDPASVILQDQPADAWRRSVFGAASADPAVGGDFADPDHDGRSNLLEYIEGTMPNQPDVVSLTPGASQTEFYVEYRRAVGTMDISVQPEWTADFSQWSTLGWSESVVATTGGIQTRRLAWPRSSGARVVRLRVTRPSQTIGD